MRAPTAAGASRGTGPYRPDPPRLVCKLGGSLLDAGWAPPLVGVLRRAGPGLGILLLAGGGRAADRVRGAYRRGRLGRTEAHWAAVRALDANALRLSGVGGGDPLPLVTGPGAGPGRREGTPWRTAPPAGLAVLAPGPALRSDDPLPHGWDVTSDSIAAWAADRAGASDLLLLKARDGRSRRGGRPRPGGRSSGRRGRATGPSGASGLSAARAARQGLVDRHLPALLQGAGHRAWILNGRHPDRLLAFLTGDETAAVRLLP